MVTVGDPSYAALVLPSSTARRQKQPHEYERELAQLKDQNRMLGERARQLETIVQSSFARAVRTLSASNKQIGPERDGARVVAIVEDHFKAMRLCAEHDIPAETAESAVRWLLGERARQLAAVPTDRPPAGSIHEQYAGSIPPLIVIESLPPAEEVAGTYALAPKPDDEA